MPPARLRLRTVMIVIAALAAVMGAIRFLALQCGVTNVAVWDSSDRTFAS